jgi:hypothetical protein
MNTSTANMSLSTVDPPDCLGDYKTNETKYSEQNIFLFYTVKLICIII